VDPVPHPLFLRKSGRAGNRTRTSGSVSGNSDHQTTETKLLALREIIPIKEAERSKARNVLALLNIETAGSYPTRDIDVCFLSIFMSYYVSSCLATD
jgi:hypothetical protein